MTGHKHARATTKFNVGKMPSEKVRLRSGFRDLDIMHLPWVEAAQIRLYGQSLLLMIKLLSVGIKQMRDCVDDDLICPETSVNLLKHYPLKRFGKSRLDRPKK